MKIWGNNNRDQCCSMLQMNQCWLSLYRFKVRSDPDGLFWWTEELKSKVVGVRDLVGACHRSGTHIYHSLTSLQDSHYTWTSAGYHFRFGVRSDPDGLFWWTERLVGGMAQIRHPYQSLSYTLTRLTLHLNQCWLSQQVQGKIWPGWPVLRDWRVEIQSCWCDRLVGGMAQIRHPSITLSHPYKAHTTPEPVLTVTLGFR